MYDNQKVKVEASIPVQSRIDVRTLADLVGYWEEEGVHIRTMSQLVSWSLDMCRDILENNGKLESIKLVTDGYNKLMETGLHQPGVMKQGKRKITRAMGFEELRLEGTDPRGYAKDEYNKMHNDRSVKASPDTSRSLISDKMWNGAMERIKEEEEKELKEEIEMNKVKLGEKMVKIKMTSGELEELEEDRKVKDEKQLDEFKKM